MIKKTLQISEEQRQQVMERLTSISPTEWKVLNKSQRQEYLNLIRTVGLA